MRVSAGLRSLGCNGYKRALGKTVVSSRATGSPTYLYVGHIVCTNISTAGNKHFSHQSLINHHSCTDTFLRHNLLAKMSKAGPILDTFLRHGELTQKG